METVTAEDSQGEVAHPGSLDTRQTVEQANIVSSGARSCLTPRLDLTHPSTGMELRAEQHGVIKSEDT